jgi:hypothetical protein
MDKPDKTDNTELQEYGESAVVELGAEVIFQPN